MITFPLPSLAKSAISTPNSSDNRPPIAGQYPPLPQATVSFGAAMLDGWLYVYGGHTGGAHEHSRKNLSSHFVRIKLERGTAWQELTLDRPLQGLPLVAHGNSLYRVGGMFAKNEPDEDDELYSVADFSRFDVQSNKWEALAPLPKARSSHDAVVIGEKIYVSGGWHLLGEAKGEWHTKSLVFDLTQPTGSWHELPEQPFKRRALATSHWQGKLIVIGGINDQGKISNRFDLYDPTTETWSLGPEIPGEHMAGFGISAWNHLRKLYINGFDGNLYQLTDDGKSWESTGKLITPRFFHRLLPAGPSRLLVVGGASHKSGYLDDIEFVEQQS